LSCNVSILSSNFTNLTSTTNGTVANLNGVVGSLFINNSYFSLLKGTNGGGFYISGCPDV
jgi:hypothetical protein